MNLIEAIKEKVADLDASGDKQAAVKYFKPYVPDLSRQQLNAWLKNGKFPFEMANGLFEQDFESAPNPTAPPTRQPRRNAREVPVPDPEDWNGGPETEPPPTSGFADETEATLPPHMISGMRATTAAGQPLPEAAVNKLPHYGEPSRRTPDIQRLERRTPIADQDYDPVLESQIIAVLIRLGIPIPAQRPRADTRQPEILGARPKLKFRQRSWNEPPPQR